MKTRALLAHLKRFGCELDHEGRGHSMWINLRNNRMQAVPRHVEIKDRMARGICRGLGVPEIGKSGQAKAP